MKTRFSILAAIPALFALQLAGCGDPPQPIDAPKSEASKSPPPVPGTDPARVAGTIKFEGAGFDAPTGYLYVSVHPKGSGMPLYSRQYPLKGVVFEKDAAGVRSMKFEVGTQNLLGTGPTSTEAPSFECELAVKYKENMDALSKTLAEAKADYQAGKSDYLLTLTFP